MSFDFRAYWPNPAAGKQLLVQHATRYSPGGPVADGILWRYVRGGQIGGHDVVRLDNYISDALLWYDFWKYRADPVEGLIEVADAARASDAVMSPTKNIVLKAAKPIKWGGVQNVGDSITHPCEIDVAASTGVPSGPWIYGTNSVEFLDFLPTFTNEGGMVFADVVKIRFLQGWCATAACDYPAGQNLYAAVDWFAPGLGPIQVDFIDPQTHALIRREWARAVTETTAMPTSTPA